MANASTPGHALVASPQPQPRGPPRRASSSVKDKVTPIKTRFAAGATARPTAHDSINLLPSPTDAKQITTHHSSDNAQHPLDVQSVSLGSLNVQRSKSEVKNHNATSEKKLHPAVPPLPVPPPFPSFSKQPWRAASSASTLQHPYTCSGSFVSEHTLNAWDQVFFQGTDADLAVCTNDGSRIYVHSAVLMASSPVFKFCLRKELRKSRPPVLLSILGVPFHAVRCFLRYLYSSRCERFDMEECALHLVVLAHTYMVPALKCFCTMYFEQKGMLSIDSVVDILQIARLCDAPRLYLLCLRRIVSDFKTVVRSEGWRAMKHSDPALEQELLEAVIRASMKKQDKLTKLEDDQVYAQLYDAMEALTHICRDGCRSIGSADKSLSRRPTTSCSYPACNRMESLVRHFADCQLKVAGGCEHCKRMWQLLELHSRMCSTGDSCKVPLCRHFKDGVSQQSSLKVQLRWKMLVLRVTMAKRAVDALSVADVAKQLKRAI